MKPIYRRINTFILLLTLSTVAYATQSLPDGWDDYTAVPFSKDYATRRAAIIERELESGSGVYAQLLRLEMGEKPDEDHIQHALDKADRRVDCADFDLQGVIRIAYHHSNNPLLSDDMKQRIKTALLNFKYWPDEPGKDSMCSWSENHYILFSTAGYLTGQLYPDEVFTNSGRTGKEQMERFKPRIEKWLELRYKIGFSEWLSNVYYEEDFAALMNLTDLMEDEEISKCAAMVTDLLLADMALNSYEGIFGSTHGRSYEGNKNKAMGDNTRGLTKLAFGLHSVKGGMATIPLAVNRKYRIPGVIYEMATHTSTMVNKQRMSMNIEDAPKYGLDVNRLEDGMTFLTMEAYCHPMVVDTFKRMLDEYDWWDNEFLKEFKNNKELMDTLDEKGALAPLMWYQQKDVGRNHRPEVNIYTYRTPDYMLSTAQDYRPGYGGDQHSIWQATLGSGAICYTTHPEREEAKSPSYWTGSGSLPRSAQIENVNITLYKVDMSKGTFLTYVHAFTHAWLPKEQFDEIVEKDHWVFTRKGDAYLALWSKKPTRWQNEGEYRDNELIAEGRKNIWICELGSKSEYNNFEEFMDAITKHPVATKFLNVSYQSPSQGLLTFGWDEELTQDGKDIKLDDYPRYDNPYTDAPFPGNTIRFDLNGQSLELDWEAGTRTASTYLEP